jgi:Flp pilus assembly protein TadB
MGALDQDPVWETLLLCVWWSVWTVADTYLIQYTPWSELGVLLACALLLCCLRVRRARRKRAACRQSAEAQDTPLNHV